MFERQKDLGREKKLKWEVKMTGSEGEVVEGVNAGEIGDQPETNNSQKKRKPKHPKILTKPSTAPIQSTTPNNLSSPQPWPRRHTNPPKTTTPSLPASFSPPRDASHCPETETRAEEPLPPVARCRLLPLPAHVADRPTPGEDPAALTTANRASHCLARTRTREEKLLPPVSPAARGCSLTG
ncbi:hypothetical protein Drorol1_Dr00004513 [Drosera rotundifolia]